jgi:hypothetical protein
LTGALKSATTGGLFYGAGSLVQALPGVTDGETFTDTQALIEASLIHVGAGAASGAIGAAVGGSNARDGRIVDGRDLGRHCRRPRWPNTGY